MSDKESPITIHDSDSESDSENLTEHASGRDSEQIEGLNNIIEGPVPNLPLLGTECTENQKESEELVLLEGDQHALPSGSNIRPEGFNLAVPTFDTVSQERSDLECTERPTHEMNVEAVNLSTLNTTCPDFETRLLSQSLQSQGLNGAGRLLEKMNMQNQSQGECLENQTNHTMSEAEQCVSDPRIERSQSNYTEGSILYVMFPGIEDRLLSQSLQIKGLERVGRLLEEMYTQKQIPPRAECTGNQTNCTVQVMKKLIMHKPTTQTDQSEPIVVDSGDDEDEAQVSVPLSPSLQFQGLEGVGMLMEEQNAHCSDDEDEAQVLVPLSPSLQFQGLEEEQRLLEEQNPPSHIQTRRELECTKNQTGSAIMEAGQWDMDCTVNKEVFVTSEGDQHDSGIDMRSAVGTNDSDTPQKGRKRGLSPDLSQGATSLNLSPSKRKSKTGGEFRMKRNESYNETYVYTIILPFHCPSKQKVVKVGVSGNPKRRFDHIKWGLKAIIQDEFAESAELKLKDGICLSRTTPADKIIDEIFISRIRMQAVEHQKAESEVRNLIMAADVIDRDFFMSLQEAINNTSDTHKEAVQKIDRINNSCGPTEWILSDTRTVEALRNAYKNGELDGTAKSMMDDKCMWGSYQEFITKLQNVIRKYYQ